MPAEIFYVPNWRLASPGAKGGLWCVWPLPRSPQSRHARAGGSVACGLSDQTAHHASWSFQVIRKPIVLLFWYKEGVGGGPATAVMPCRSAQIRHSGDCEA